MSTTVNAALVMKLRERTGSGMMECKKFLLKANGDIEKAALEMRKAGQAKADTKANRIAAEGVVVAARSADGHFGVILEVNSETDFVSRDTHFMNYANKAIEVALNSDVKEVGE